MHVKPLIYHLNFYVKGTINDNYIVDSCGRMRKSPTEIGIQDMDCTKEYTYVCVNYL